MQQNKRILWFAPIHNREFILPQYLKHISDLTYPKHLMSFYFLVNNCTDQSLNILKKFKEENSQYENINIEVYNTYFSKDDERTEKVRNSYTYVWLSQMRNKGMKQCVKGNYDYILSCDSDILVRKDLIERALENNKPYIASLIYNGYKYIPPEESATTYDPIANAYKYPNILKKEGNGYKHIVNYKTKNPNLNPQGTLVETHFTGACFLAHRDVCKVMKYEAHSMGEDLPASESAIKAGFTLWCDCSLYNQHCMDQNILNLYLEGKLKYSNGDTINL